MKKALILLLMIITMSAGLYFNPAHGIDAAVVPTISEPGKSGTTASFYTDEPELTQAIVEYTFHSNGVYMSKLKTFYVSLSAQNTSMTVNKYTFTLPAEALAFKVWRVITEDEYIKSVSGNNVYSTVDYSMEGIELRLKTLYVTNDLITREATIGTIGGLLKNQYKFIMHFRVEDSLGEIVPIDRIHSLKVEYDVVTTYIGLIDSKTHYIKDIQATENRSLSTWPFIYPAHVVTNIQESTHLRDDNIVGNEIYDWMVTLGIYDYQWPASTVTLDQTTLLTIDYYYNDVFYQDQEVVDKPYEAEDIIDVIPGTTDPLDSIWTTVWEWIKANPETVIKIVLGLIATIVIGKVLSAIKIVMDIVKGIFKGLGWILKLVFIGVYYVLYFIFIMIPKGIWKVIYFLFVPYQKRQIKERTVIEYANRSI